MPDFQGDAEQQLIQPRRQIVFDLPAFDRFLSAHGAEVEHWRAMRCPGGMITTEDYARPHEDHEGCSAGFLYRKAGTCFIGFTGNGTSQRQMDTGQVSSSRGSATFTSTYREGGPVRVAQYDRLYLLDESVLVDTWELFQHSASGVDRLDFPAVQVLELVASSGEEYRAGDFSLDKGRLVWGGRAPTVNPEGRGEICSVRYRYRPYWYVKEVPHELRLQVGTNVEGRALNAVNQAAYLLREYYFKTEDRDREARPSPRQADEPAITQFQPPDYR